MTIENRHPQALAGNLHVVRGNDLPVFNVTEDPEGLLLGLLFLSADEGNDVSFHLRPLRKILSGTADGLVGRCDDGFGPEGFPGRKDRRIGLDGAVGLDGNEAPLRAQPLLLVFDDVKVSRIDLRDDHGNVGRPAVGAVVRNDRGFRLRVFLFDLPNLVLRHVHGRKNKVDILRNFLNVRDVLEDQVLYIRRDGRVHLPAAFHRLRVGLSGAPPAGCDRSDLEPGMVFEEGDKALSDHSGRPEDTDIQFLHFQSPSFPRTRPAENTYIQSQVSFAAKNRPRCLSFHRGHLSARGT